MNPDKNFRSHARWPENTIAFSMNGTQITTDNHNSEEEAQAVCNILEREGYGGNDKVFPVETWVTPIPFEELHPEEAQKLMGLCSERAEKKAKGKRLKPMYIDPENIIPEPIVAEKQIGRNDPCPCNSGKKFKKCCIDA